jgi:two-component system, NarL family, nitrate/nitrite response regulator NarL
MAEADLLKKDPPIRVYLLTTVRLYRDAVGTLLGRHQDLIMLGAADPSSIAVASLVSTSPDVVLLDIGNAAGLSFAGQLTAELGRARILGFAVEDTEPRVIACAEAGLSGYVPSHATADELVAAVRHVARGGIVCSQTMAAGLFRHIGRTAGTSLDHQCGTSLTGRQRQIARLLDEGLSNKEIARRLSLGTSTVKNHVHDILDRLNVASRAEAAARLRRVGL